ncbi:MAG: SpoIIE family protein phosphatase, partial [Synergistaceae bacterium]|nr:SpoIIE family protein phosphatase [Synergistaceae bacterium]
ISSGNLDYRAKIHDNDEIGDLAKSFNDMAVSLKDYIRDLAAVTAEKERIGAELNVATKIQADMLPRIFPPYPDRKEFDIYATMTPAKEVGGDFYDFFLINHNHLGLVMADVSGKGVPAALFMVIAKTLIKNRAMMGGSPAEILHDVNNQLCEGNDAELFVTVWLGILEISTGKIVSSNAGHEYPALKRADGKFELLKSKHSPAVATMEDIKFREIEFSLNSGDILYIYTDGVAEATNSAEELYGTDRMIDALNKNADAPIEEILADVKKDVDDFTGDAPQFDDITMLGIKYYGQEVNKMVETKKLDISAEIKNLDTVLTFVDEQLEKYGCTPKVQMQIDIAVEEIFVNIANYAYNPEIGSADIIVEIQEEPLAVTITFTDGGVPYDPLKKPDPDITLPAEERQIGGLGIYMVKKSMDDISYEYKEGKNILTLKKNL